MIAPAQETDIDRSGRIVIPPTLREYAGLARDCIVLGLKKYIEVWAESAWNAYLEENESRFKEAAEELGGRIVL